MRVKNLYKYRLEVDAFIGLYKAEAIVRLFAFNVANGYIFDIIL